MSSLLFIRHAETDMAGTLCGHSDPPVNVSGKDQIRKLIQTTDLHLIDSIYCSDLQRATTTANAIARTHNVPVHITSALREIHFGVWEGLTWQQIEQHDLTYARRWVDEFPHLAAPGGETFADFESRIRNQLKQLPTPAANKQIVIVTHAGVMRAILSLLNGCSPDEAWDRTKNYCSTFILESTINWQENLQ